MEKAQKQVNDFMEAQGLSFSLEARMLDLVSEVGELAKEVLKGSDYGTAPLLPGAGLEEEMGDCLFSPGPVQRHRPGRGEGPCRSAGEVCFPRRPDGPGGQRAVKKR